MERNIHVVRRARAEQRIFSFVWKKGEKKKVTSSLRRCLRRDSNLSFRNFRSIPSLTSSSSSLRRICDKCVYTCIWETRVSPSWSRAGVYARRIRKLVGFREGGPGLLSDKNLDFRIQMGISVGRNYYSWVECRDAAGLDLFWTHRSRHTNSSIKKWCSNVDTNQTARSLCE